MEEVILDKALERELYKIPRTAELLDVSPALVWRWIATGKLRTVTINGVKRVPASAIRELCGE